jgi:hypothetical protein
MDDLARSVSVAVGDEAVQLRSVGQQGCDAGYAKNGGTQDRGDQLGALPA